MPARHDILVGALDFPRRTTPDPTWAGTPALPAERPPYRHCYDDSRTYFRPEEDFPGPKTMSAAGDWIRTSAGSHDRFFLLVDEFDPHEPFDTPLPYAAMYNEELEGGLAIWPPYVVDAVASGLLDLRKARYIRGNYGAKLTMIDHWFGRLLEAVEDAGLADSTGVVLCSDHGHYLGEHDIFGKPGAPVYSELGIG
jgi:arylsulfatase A-like enzyme